MFYPSLLALLYPFKGDIFREGELLGQSLHPSPHTPTPQSEPATAHVLIPHYRLSLEVRGTPIKHSVSLPVWGPELWGRFLALVR